MHTTMMEMTNAPNSGALRSERAGATVRLLRASPMVNYTIFGWGLQGGIALVAVAEQKKPEWPGPHVRSGP